MKAILVVDLPDGINSEEYKGFLTVDRFYATDEEIGTKIDDEPMRFGWLKIKPLPQKKETRNAMQYSGLAEEYRKEGWNACLEEIENAIQKEDRD